VQSQERNGAGSNQRYLIAGLGNPGRKYRRSRHSIGFAVIDELAKTHEIALNRKKHRAQVGSGRIADCSVILAKPQTFMNLSGDSIGPLAKYHQVPSTHVLVIYDELDLPLGTLRLREKGGAGGHNGMRSIINHLGQEFPRMRLGIGRPPGQMSPAAYVLQNVGEEEALLLSRLIAEAVRAIETFLKDGVDIAMTRHNGPVEPET
jgi:PTH1 family peptidyl-tRNA hydrolase